MIRQKLLPALVIIAALVGTAAAQSAAKGGAQDMGFTSYAEFGGTSNTDGQVYEINSSAGYNFSQHFGIDVGIPVYFVRASASTGSTSTNDIGNPYLNLRFKFLNPAVNFGSTLTGFAPIADTKKGLSTGRGTFDWTNHFDHSWANLTPFAELGIANTITDTRLFMRPYTTLGFNTHFQAGANYDIWKFFSVGGSAYDILPSGQQTVFSKIVSGSGNGGPISHGRVFQGNQQTTGSADIARDNGFSSWIDASPGRVVDMELGFTRSLQYELNSVSFTIGFNLAHLYRKSPN